VLAALIAGSGALFSAAPAQGQGTDAGDGWRIGVTMGGISTFGLVFEAYRDGRSVDVTLGTFGFRDLGLAVSGKQYFGGRAARPFAGLGFWAILAPGEDRPGLGLIARVPVGLDWNVTGPHAIGAEIGINRAIAVRRPDPEDDRPIHGRLVPLPGVYYRWTP